MNELPHILKELTTPLFQRRNGVAIFFIFFVTAMAIPHIAAPLITAHPIAGFVLLALAAYGEVRLITRLERE